MIELDLAQQGVEVAALCGAVFGAVSVLISLISAWIGDALARCFL